MKYIKYFESTSFDGSVNLLIDIVDDLDIKYEITKNKNLQRISIKFENEEDITSNEFLSEFVQLHKFLIRYEPNYLDQKIKYLSELDNKLMDRIYKLTQFELVDFKFKSATYLENKYIQLELFFNMNPPIFDD